MLRASVCLTWLLVGSAAISAPSACDNSMNPVVSGWVWNYRTTPKDGKAPTSYTEQHQPTAGGFQVVFTQNGKTSAQTWTCIGGAQTNQSLPDLQGATITTAVLSGVTTPPAALWREGHTWTFTWDVEGHKGLLSGGGKLTMTARILGREQVTLPAGTFNAWKVGLNGVVDAHLAMVPIKRIYSVTQWIVPWIGTVRTQSDTGLTELMSLKKGL